ncbi:MAG: hypothetical protein PHV82_00300 [Victivallaceae bacterium]|nr:hypothetical protein [Victivallaceae bacterium]
MRKNAVNVPVLLAALLFLLNGCDSAEKSGKIPGGSNSAPNPSFEESRVFSGGISRKEKSFIEKPVAWVTRGQILNDCTGWSAEEAHSGTRSLKIENIGGTVAYWEGAPVVLRDNANAFKCDVWTKTKEMRDTGKGKFRLAFHVFYKSGNSSAEKIRTFCVDLPRTVHDWEKTSGKIFVGEKIARIIPCLYFSEMAGTAWFDDISLEPYFDKGKVLFASNVRNAFAGKTTVSSDEDGEKIYCLDGAGQAVSRDFIAVCPDKIYKLSGRFKSASGNNSLIYFGFIPYDKNKTYIGCHAVRYIKNTETELAKKCTAKDNVIFVKDARNWVKKNSACIVFEVDDSGKYSDLPNFNYSSAGIEKISREDGYWKIELKTGCRRTYPANTKIREHFDDGSGTYIYSAAKCSKVPDRWTAYEGTVRKDNKHLPCIFRPGTEYVKIVILQTGNTLLDFKNIKLKEF